MDSQKTKKVGYSKALIASLAAFCCLLIYILACVSSPVTWSPDSSQIAILVTMPPGDDPDHFAIFTYDISTRERVLLDEVKADGVLSAPAWSPDGKWIAYYRVEPSPSVEPVLPPHTDPNSSASTVKSTEQATLDAGVKKCKGKGQKKVIGEELFSEENKVLPYFLFDIIEEGVSEEAEETFDVKLVIVSPDGKEKKEESIQFNDSSDARKVLMIMQPQWSKDSRHLFYARLLDSEDLYYISSLNIDTGEMCAHFFSSSGSFSLSPDGNWIASLLKNESKKFLLNIARVDGTMQKYFKLDLEIEEEALLLGLKASWSRDSKYVVVTANEEFGIIDTNTGKMQKYSDPDSEMVAHGTFSPVGDKLFYMAQYDVGEPNSTEEKVALSFVTLNNRKTGIMFLPKFEELGQISVSPNGKMFLVRGTIEDEQGNEKSALIFWDGKTQQVVKTDRWLKTPFYTDDDLIFEEKLIGNWKDNDAEILISKGKTENTYKIILTEQDGETQTFAANLIKLNNLMFLGIFYDENVLQENNTYDRLLPDGFVRVDQIEPKPILQEIEYEEVFELFNIERDLLKQEKTTAN